MEKLEYEEARDLFLRIKVAHHIDGRVRLKLDGVPPSWVIASPKSLQEKLEKLPGILSVRANALAGSATVHYDKSLLSPELFKQLGLGNIEPMMEWIKKEGVIA